MAIRCINCNSNAVITLDSRMMHTKNIRRRRIKCHSCNIIFTTKEEVFIKKERSKIMPKLVKGYQTVDGRFFENSIEADYEERKFFLEEAMVVSIYVQGIENNILKFINENLDIVKDYCIKRKEYNLKDNNDIDELSNAKKGKEIIDGSSKKSATTKK